MNKDLFVKAHWTQVIILGVVVILVVSWQVFLEEADIFNQQKIGVVKGEAIEKNQVDLETEANQFILNYQNNIKRTVHDYLEKRADFDKPHQAWLFLINNTKYKLLSLSVPKEYKELQAQIITTLDAELATISGVSSLSFVQINDKWQKILDQYFWLNQ